MRKNNYFTTPRVIRPLLAIIFFLLLSALSFGQIPKPNVLNKIKGRVGNVGKSTRPSTDTVGFERRDDLADSITISYRYLDSLKANRLDSSLHDFSRFFSVPANYITLGNNGSASYPVLFTPLLRAGWDAGFHAYDAYRFTLERTKFYKTTRPFTQLTYLLASAKEQVINVLHTQNVKPN